MFLINFNIVADFSKKSFAKDIKNKNVRLWYMQDEPIERLTSIFLWNVTC